MALLFVLSYHTSMMCKYIVSFVTGCSNYLLVLVIIFLNVFLFNKLKISMTDRAGGRYDVLLVVVLVFNIWVILILDY